MRYVYFLFLLTVAACNAAPDGKPSSYRIEVLQSQLLKKISSGSGLILDGARAFIISDNVNGFFEIDTGNLNHRFYPFQDSLAPVIENKDVKSDFENGTLIHFNGKKHVLAFGSGALGTTREKILLFPLDDPGKHRIFPARQFYSLLKSKMQIDSAQMNLEACFSSTDSIFLLNRGSNQLISFDIDDFETMVKSGFTSMPVVGTEQYELPRLENYMAGFSGACFLNKESFLFTATVEKTQNWIDDGEVAGSYIGIASFSGEILFIGPVKDKDGSMIKQKLESVELVSNKKTSLQLFAISDNDDGQSTWFNINLARQ